MPKRRSKSGVLGVAVLRRRRKGNEGRWWDVARPRQRMGRRGGSSHAFTAAVLVLGQRGRCWQCGGNNLEVEDAGR